jgi:hypothetical protein
MQNNNNNLNTPIAVTVSQYPQYVPPNDEKLAYATPVMNSQPYAIPIYVQSTPQNTPIYGVDHPQSQYIIQTDAPFSELLQLKQLSRSMTFLAAIDAIIVVLLSIFSIIWLIFLWGPLCGYYGAKRFIPSFIYIYGLYWFIRLAFDMYAAILGYWWYIISVAIDLFILRYVLVFGNLLRHTSPETIALLRER